MSEYDRDLYSASDHSYTLRENIKRLEAEIVTAKKQGALEFADRIGFAVSANMECEGSAREVMQHVLNHIQLLRAEIEGEK